jgi:penicillin amidase
VTKRIGQGRISEFAGESTLTKDVFLKAVGFYDIAKKEVEKLSPVYRQLLQRYVDGVNYYLETGKKPLYMMLMGIEKEPWTLADPLVVGLMLNWTLAYNMSHELLYYKISEKIGPAKTRELLNLVPANAPTIVQGRLRPGIGNDTFFSGLRPLGFLMGGRSASNNWVVAPQKTAVTGPILASDPHVHGSKIPSDFYLIRARAGDFEVSGGQVAGLPFIAFGYNKHIAWGLTNQGADIVDVFFETVDWDKKTCLMNGKPAPLKTKAVEIKIKGRDPVKKTLYYAGRRPLLNDVFPELKKDISIDWVGFDGIGATGLFQLNRAENYSQFVRAANQIFMTPQNIVYGDKEGNIAYRTIGSLPARKKGTGNFPQDGARTAANWNQIIDPDLNPAQFNPDQGFIATANNRVIPNYPFDMNGTYAPRFRYQRLAAMLTDKSDIDFDYVKGMQIDTESVLAKKMVAKMTHLVKVNGDKRLQSVLDRVTAWNGNAAVDQAAPAVYNTWLVRFMYQTFVDDIGEDLATEYVGQRYISLERFLFLLENQSSFFDDVRTSEKETAEDMANRAFKEALQLLQNFFSSKEMDDWQWGKIHLLRFDHLLSKSKLLKPLVSYGPFPVDGDCETNKRAHFYEITPPFTATLASGLRLIVEFDPAPKGHMVLITGENEYFLSQHYTDLTDLWLKNGYFSMEEEKPVYKTELLPSGGK